MDSECHNEGSGNERHQFKDHIDKNPSTTKLGSILSEVGCYAMVVHAYLIVHMYRATQSRKINGNEQWGKVPIENEKSLHK
jgi:hypothetical protein